jgi:hypothetical protein
MLLGRDILQNYQVDVRKRADRDVPAARDDRSEE